MKATELNARLPYTFGNEIEYLQQLGKTLQPHSHVVMLGVGPAVMALALLEGATCAFNFWGVDAFNATGLAHLKEAGFEGCLNFISSFSWAAAQRFENNSVDLLIIDAAHDYSSVCKDIVAWYDKVKQNGILFFHDWTALESDNGVQQAINEHKTLFWQELAQPGVSIVFRKIE
jgi:hypothetical protein